MPTIAPKSRVFVDECKAKAYYIAAAAILPAATGRADKALRQMLKPGQRRIHFNQESDSRRRLLLSRMTELDVQVHVYSVRGKTERVARDACLNALIDDLVSGGADALILERDAPIEHNDRRTIRDALLRNGHHDLSYRHAEPAEFALLWVSDAVAWCCNAGGDWRRRVAPLVAHHRTL